MEGHTLSILLKGYDPDIYACRSARSNYVQGPLLLINGTLKTVAGVTGCWLQDVMGLDGSQGGSLYLNSVIRLNGNATVSNLTINATRSDVSCGDKSQYAFSVCGTYKLVSEWGPNVKMLNGSRLDLREVTGAFASDNIPSSVAGVKKITYADGATVTVDLRGRDLESGEKVVAWSAKPENVTSLKFIADCGKDRPVKLRVANDGLYFYPATLAIYIR